MTQPFRIVISGPAGAGKTSLAAALGERLGLPVIPENLGAVYAAREAFILCQRDRTSTHEQQRDLLARWMQSFFDWCDDRASRYAAAPSGYVADRWEADHVSHWLRAMAQYRPDGMTAELLARLDARARQIDLAIILAPGTHAVESRNEDALRRNTDLTTATLSFSTTLSLLTQLELGSQLLTLPGSVFPDARLSTIVRRLMLSP